ncbi:hypothetical protein NAV33_07200 [Pseudomonas stutzeri]|uniref:hypothetical protein n=1 Tax=Stutzerimonas stutzeri TaxID=316 RepID=UPI00210BA171|nr:hypothetical protein [Stutzerimonas stutzeri]MCQ4311680.1 hypothetical protein [Stutzerimonas stutzeri]
MSVQHIVTGYGAPSEAPPSLCAHYLDLDTETEYRAKGTASSDDWVQIPTGASSGGGDGLTKENFVELVPKGYLGNAANSDKGGLQLFNRKDIGCLFYGSLSNYLAVAPVYQVGTGPLISFGEYQNWSLGIATCNHVYTVTETGKDAILGIAPPAGQFGSLNLDAESFGEMYNEIPAAGFRFDLEILAPTMATGDSLTIEFKIAGHNTISLSMDPVTRMWSVNGTDIEVQPEYLSSFNVQAGALNGSGYPETALINLDGSQVEVPLSTSGYSGQSGMSISARVASGAAVQIGRTAAHVVYGEYS